jgi:uncharacterized protein (TIGR00296 family)
LRHCDAFGGFRAEQFMQIFLSNRRWTASGNGIRGEAARSVPYKTVTAAPSATYPHDGVPPAMLDDADGAAAVALARRALEGSLAEAPPRDAAAPFRTVSLPAVFDQPRGVFVTLSRHPSGDLRGCIGFPLPVYPLRAALPRAARSSALDDPRFPPVESEELGRLRVEVSILTVPAEIPSEPRSGIPAHILVGRDGLIVDRPGASGLLLPQVGAEYGWDAEEFLAETCEKAGLPRNAWTRSGTTVRRFEADVFGEARPGGPVHRIPLAVPHP